MLRMTFTASSIFAGLALAGCATAPMGGGSMARTCPAATQADIERQFDLFNAAWATKDPDRVTALFTRDPVLLATVSNKPRTNPAEVRDYFVSFLKNEPRGRIDTSTVEIDCDTASRLGTWSVMLTNPQTRAQSTVKARYSFIYRYEDGAWKIDHLHSSMNPEPS
jgi:uncharacterized protein (TIGR02246 family)